MIVDAIRHVTLSQAVGFHPTNFVWIWSPTLKKPWRVALLELARCESDEMLVTSKASQASLGLHPGHRLRGPICLSFLEWFQVFFGLIR